MADRSDDANSHISPVSQETFRTPSMQTLPPSFLTVATATPLTSSRPVAHCVPAPAPYITWDKRSSLRTRGPRVRSCFVHSC